MSAEGPTEDQVTVRMGIGIAAALLLAFMGMAHDCESTRMTETTKREAEKTKQAEAKARQQEARLELQRLWDKPEADQ